MFPLVFTPPPPPLLTDLKVTMSSTRKNEKKDVDKMNVYELRGHISELLRTDFSDRLAELERLMNEAIELLHAKESKPPRSDWWDVRVLIEKENQSNYNKTNNSETIGCAFCALKLEYTGHPDELTLACRTDPKLGVLVTHLYDFPLADFPGHMQVMCKNFFPGVERFEFFVRAKAPPLSSTQEFEKGEFTDAAVMLTARAKMNTLIIELEELKDKLQGMINQNLPLLRDVLKDPLETCADSDPEESGDDDDDNDGDDGDDDEASDEKGRPTNPSPKRRKMISELGMGKDTWRQHVSNFGIQVSPGQAIKNTRIREFRGDAAPHYVNTLGAWATGFDCVTSKTLPVPRAPAFSHGAEGTHDRAGYKLIPPGEDVNSNTAVTQKMMDEDAKNNTNVVANYEQMHTLAREMRRKIGEIVRTYNESFAFVVRVHNSEASLTRDLSVNELTWMQKLAIGRLYLDAISVNKGTGEEEDEPDGGSGGEEEDEEEEEEEDSKSDVSYTSEDESDEDESEDDESENGEGSSGEDSDEE